jgi:hypothetical protein
MKRSLKIVATLVIIFSSICNLSAQEYKSSVGIRLGTSINASYKIFIEENQAIEAIAGISRVGGNSLGTIGGLYQVQSQLTNKVNNLDWYIGAGGFYRFANENINSNLLISTVIGLEYTFETAPINLFIDILPYYNVLDKVEFDADASLGVRYIF